VDVVEFDGSHIRKFYADMADRFQQFIEQNKDRMNLDRLRPEVSPLAAVMLVTRLLLNYFAVEIVFGVPHIYFAVLFGGRAFRWWKIEVTDQMKDEFLQRAAKWWAMAQGNEMPAAET
jgi:hypothetical protein